MKADEKEEKKKIKMDQIDKDKIIALQRQKIEDLSIKVNALEQEVALLHHEIKQQKKAKKSPTL